MTAYDRETVQHLNELPPEDKTEDLGVEIDISRFKGLEYDNYPVVMIGWWFDVVYFWYDTNTDNPTYANQRNRDEVPDSWERVEWKASITDNGTIVIDSTTAVGVLSYPEAIENDSPGAESILPVYEHLERIGFSFENRTQK